MLLQLTTTSHVSTIDGFASTIDGDVSLTHGLASTIDGLASTIHGDVSTIDDHVSTIDHHVSTIYGLGQKNDLFLYNLFNSCLIQIVKFIEKKGSLFGQRLLFLNK